ncbi:hypothetical protein NBRC10512_000491 [Rhodotorula toruloides]|uniref:RHTO0S04e09516g1_1 n=2 Tax=Rhodotorula toruloides TaxID=5286 RepID=A0A061AQE5_RHOTO|nr:uncharacterized protein RHTO_05205 [Rhodotorula toruloides NP11]EMS19258.1 hypothetical protein RHTO_05205 [Rhodotorula toruloides NP11]KAJ8293743.1 hypothetical protein OF846_003013 [Rhodotorula toruloides]CDR39790.1 RHTO0S04e09516g1_1 [Rhodotorula toruloides]
MADDELDPAFLDLDSHAHALDSLDSLGPGFGSSLDPLDDELGDGFGRALGNELDALDGVEDGRNDLDGAGRSRHSSRTASTLELVEDDEDEDGGSRFSTPQRRRQRAPNAPQSLAFELASAARPQRHRDLMKELGLDDEDGQGLEGSSSDDEGGASSEMDEREARQGPSSSASPSATASDPFASPRRPQSRLHFDTPASSAPNSSNMSRTGTLDGNDEVEEDNLAKEAEIDAALEEASASLTDSIAAATSFLDHLRQHTTSSETQPSTAATPSSLSSAPSGTAPPVDYTDRQPRVESLAQSVLRNVVDLAQQREAQVRELTEAERVFARTDAGWKAVLADLEPLDLEEEDPSTTHGSEADSAATLPNGDQLEDGTRSDQPSHLAPLPPSLSAQALSELASLRTLTASLLSALSSLSDITQMQSALASDAGRKLRALKAQVGGVKDDLLAIERSEAFVQAFEKREGTERCGGRYSARARGELVEVERRLDEGWRKAQEILTIRA